VEKAETLDLLRRDAPQLERALNDAGLKTGDNGLQFALRDQSFAGRHEERAAPAMARVIVPDAELAPVEAGGYGRLPRACGGIDIQV
jgi:flagellar hook-length control protein FliK